MKKLITIFNTTGVCEVDVQKVVKSWSDKFIISQWKDDFALVKFGRGENKAKVQISKEQASEIITILNLVVIKCTVFNSGKTYKSRTFTRSEITRFQKLKQDAIDKVSMLNKSIINYSEALLLDLNIPM